MISLRLNDKDLLKIKRGGSLRIGTDHIAVGMPVPPNLHLSVSAPAFKRFAQLQNTGKRFILKPDMIKEASVLDSKTGGALPLTEFVTQAKGRARGALKDTDEIIDELEDQLEIAKSAVKRGKKVGGYLDPAQFETASDSDVEPEHVAPSVIKRQQRKPRTTGQKAQKAMHDAGRQIAQVAQTVAKKTKRAFGGAVSAKSLGRAISKISKEIDHNQGAIAKAYDSIDSLAHDTVATAKGGKVTLKSFGKAVSKVSKAVKDNQGAIAKAYNGIDSLAHDAISTAKGGKVTLKSFGKAVSKVSKAVKDNQGAIAKAYNGIDSVATDAIKTARGGRLVKGSPEAKEHMRRLREARMAKKGAGFTGGGIYSGR